MDMGIFEQSTALFSAIIAGITVIALLWKKIIKPLYIGLSKFYDLVDNIELVVAEFTPNGGSSIRDAVDRIEIRQLLSDQRQRVFFQDLNLAICETNADGECTRVNRTFARLTGRLPSELLKFNWVNAIDPDDRDRIFKEWLSAVEAKREFSAHYNILHINGTKIPVYARTFPLYGLEKLDKGKVQAVVGHIGLVTIDSHNPEVYLPYLGKNVHDMVTPDMPRLDI